MHALGALPSLWWRCLALQHNLQHRQPPRLTPDRPSVPVSVKRSSPPKALRLPSSWTCRQRDSKVDSARGWLATLWVGSKHGARRLCNYQPKSARSAEAAARIAQLLTLAVKHDIGITVESLQQSNKGKRPEG